MSWENYSSCIRRAVGGRGREGGNLEQFRRGRIMRQESFGRLPFSGPTSFRLGSSSKITTQKSNKFHLIWEKNSGSVPTISEKQKTLLLCQHIKSNRQELLKCKFQSAGLFFIILIPKDNKKTIHFRKKCKKTFF